MDNLAFNGLSMDFADDFSAHYEEPEFNDGDVVEFRQNYQQLDSLSENYVNEIESWARQALASNGFGDY